MGCARTGSTDAVRALLVAGADVDAREQSEDQTALMWGVAQRHAGVVRLLIEYGADVAARSRERRKVISRRLQSELKYGELGRNYGTDAEETRVGGFTPLLFAARQGDVPSARLLLGAGADVNDRAPDGASALVVAVHSDHRALALFLLEQGANPAAASAGYTALHAAVLTGDLVVVEALLAHGARPDAQVTLATKVTRNGQVLMIGEHLLGATPFALAAKFTEVEIMRVLAAADADARLPLKNGWTPLMLAAGASWRYAVWDRRDRALAKAPAFQAQMYDEVATLAAVTLVADLGVDLNAVDADGSTALHHIVDKGFAGVVQRLVDRGADLAVANSRGQTPLSIVERGLTGNVEAAATTTALLRSLGAS
jgi:ankyrin repeat protein